MPTGDVDLDQSGMMVARGFLVKASAQGYCAFAIRPVPEP
jgi:hypothetical protein